MYQITIGILLKFTVLVLIFCLFKKRLKFINNRAKLTFIIILIILTLMFVDVTNLLYSLSSTNAINLMSKLNETYIYNGTSLTCTASSISVKFTTDLISVFVRTIIPITIMGCIDIALIQYIRKSKNRLFTNRTSRREFHFTISVVLVNTTFFIFNLPNAISLITQSVINGSNLTLSSQNQAILSFYSTLASNLAFLFQSFEFWIDFQLNKLFRNEISDAVKSLFRRKNRIGIDMVNMRPCSSTSNHSKNTKAIIHNQN